MVSRLGVFCRPSRKSRTRFSTALSRVLAALALAPLLATSAWPQATEKVLYNFNGGSDGAEPAAGLIQDTAGNFYGTTLQGGPSNAGTVFKLDPTGKETVLYSFAGGSDGANPHTGVVQDASGNLCGTTYYGGAYGAGTVFKVNPTGTETLLHSFTGGIDGGNPGGTLILDSTGNLYGTTFSGGASGRGTVFKLDPSNTETVLYSFTGASDGSSPVGGVIRDSNGNLYGTTEVGGTDGQGTVFKVDTSGVETVLYSFTGGSDGALPLSHVIRDAAGNLYGTTVQGGSGYGVVFKVDPTGVETVLYTFTGGSDGAAPYAPVTQDPAGNLYGMTYQGGANGFGVVYKVDPTGHESVLYSFTENVAEAISEANLLLDSAGNLYGTTRAGGTSNNGTVFEIIGVVAQSPFLDFPLPGLTPYNAAIVSAFDHQMQCLTADDKKKCMVDQSYLAYGCDGTAEAYTGEIGKIGYGSNTKSCAGGPGYAQDANKDSFYLSGHYIGFGGNPPQAFLNYDGHPGFDYAANYKTSVVAATAGVVHYPTYCQLKAGCESDSENVYIGGDPDLFNVLELDPTGESGYKIFYLHVLNHPRTISLYLGANMTGQNFLASSGTAVRPQPLGTCVATQPFGSLSISGAVILNRAGLKNVKVTLTGKSDSFGFINPLTQTTAQDGTYAFSNLPSGYYHLEAWDPSEIPTHTFAAANPNIIVPENTPVTAGQEIATSGSAGNCIGPHLHFEVQKQTTAAQQQIVKYSYIPVDPYGWDGPPGTDPYVGITGGMQNSLLWSYVPIVGNVSPTTASANVPFPLTINGTGFAPNAADCLILKSASYSKQTCVHGVIQNHSAAQLVVQETLNSGTYFVRVANGSSKSNWKELVVQ